MTETIAEIIAAMSTHLGITEEAVQLRVPIGMLNITIDIYC